MAVKDFDKGDLKNNLKSAGFEDCIADDIADRVNDRKIDNWNADMGRAEALKEINVLINRTNHAYGNLSNTTPPTCQAAIGQAAPHVPMHYKIPHIPFFIHQGF